MPVNHDLIARSGDLKEELVEFALRPRFARQLDQALDLHFPDRDVVGEAEFANVLDWFILQHHLPGGHTVVELFAGEQRDLPEEERAMLLGWRDVVQGIFRIEQRDRDSIVVVNLIDELTYHVYSNLGPNVFRPVRAGSFLIARLIPIGDVWQLSGYMELLPAASRAEAHRLATELAMQHPELAFRNPEKLAQAWEFQRKERDLFIAFFGSDQVLLPGRDLNERMRAYTHFRMYEARDDEGTTAAERAEEIYGFVPDIDYQTPEELTDHKTVGVIFDEAEGLCYFADFGRIEETFADPSLASDRVHRRLVLDYLKDRNISPLPFRRLAERDPEQASQVMQRVLKQRGFSWERDGEALLRRYKSSYFKHPVLPSIALVGDPLALEDEPPPKPALRHKHWWQR